MTPAELRKYAKRYFAPEMRKRGFNTLSRKEDYYFRQIGDIYHMFWLELERYKRNRLGLMIYATTPDMYSSKKDFESVFPAVGACSGGRLWPDKLDQFAGYEWPCGNEEELKQSFEDILRAIDRVAIPWYDKIINKKALASALWVEYRDPERHPTKAEWIHRIIHSD